MYMNSYKQALVFTSSNVITNKNNYFLLTQQFLRKQLSSFFYKNIFTLWLLLCATFVLAKNNSQNLFYANKYKTFSKAIFADLVNTVQNNTVIKKADVLALTALVEEISTSTAKPFDGDGLTDGSGSGYITCTTSILSNNGFESGLTSWLSTGSPAVVNDAYAGTQAIELDNSVERGFWQTFAAVPGDLITFSGYGKNTGTTKPTFGIQFFNSSGTIIKETFQIINSSTYKKYVFSSMAPENTTLAGIVCWNSSSVGSGSAFYDEFCVEKTTLPLTNCTNAGCVLEPSFEQYAFSMDDSGTDVNWLDYDIGDLDLCDNGDGTLNIKGHIVNGRDAYWHTSNGSPCGGDDIWEVDLTMSDMQSWEAFNGPTPASGACNSNKVNFDYWDVSGTLTGKGCNAGRTINIVGPASAMGGGTYRMQVGWGGNTHNCDFGMSTWFAAEENGQPFSADIYVNLDSACYWNIRPKPNCENFVGNGEFDFGTNGWYLYQQTGNSANFTIDSTTQLLGANSAKVDITTASGTDWHIQLAQQFKTIETGKSYTLSFDAKATANRNITAQVQEISDPFASYFVQTVPLTMTAQHFTYTFTANATNISNVQILFSLGASSQTVYIDNVAFRENCASTCSITNPFPGFPIDFDNNDCFVDYDLDNNFELTDNGDSTMTITGSLVNAVDADWDAGSCTTNICGGTDSWSVNLTLFDKKNWSDFQASGGTANVHASCAGQEANIDYWDVTGTLVGTGCNAGRKNYYYRCSNDLSFPNRLWWK